MIKAVVFDLDNTVYDYDLCHNKAMVKLRDYACDKYKLKIDDFEKYFSNAKSIVKEQLGNVGSAHNRMLYMQVFLEQINHSPVKGALDMYDVYWNTMLESMQLFDYVLPLMRALRGQDIHIAVLTDLTAHIQHRKIHCLGLSEYIDWIVTSEEAGDEKPSRVAFDCILKKINIPPKQVLMIGDSQEKDIDGALSVGMHGLLFTKCMSKNMNEKCMEYINDRRDER